MKVTKEKLETNVIQLEITVEKEVFAEALEKSYRKNVKHIALPGFRKGKAPRKLIEKAYGEGIFYEDAAEFVLQDTYPQAVEQEGIEPVDRPEVDVKEIGSDKDFVYTAKVTVKPDVKLLKYTGLKVKKVEHAVTDEDVEAEINNMKERAARFVEVTDRAAENGDVAVIDFEGSVDGVPFDGGKGENHNLTLGSGQFIPGFEDQVVGKNVGEEFDVNVTFPEEYHAEELKGKAAVFKVKINGLKKKEYPEIDDEFAKDVSEFDTLAELKEATLKRLQEMAEKRTKADLENAVIDAALPKLKAEIPDAMVRNKIDDYIRDMQYNISAQMPGITFEQYLGYMGQTMDEFRESLKEKALKDVQVTLLIEAIAKAENIEVTKEQVDEEYAKLAEMYNMDVEKIKKLVSEDQIKDSRIFTNVVDFLISEAKIA